MSVAPHCGDCRMFWRQDGRSLCWGYGNTAVEWDHVCDSWAQGEQTRQLDSEPTVKWWERLFEQDRLAEAFKTVRDHVTANTLPAALTVARQMAHQRANGNTSTPDLTALEEAFRTHYERLYRLGRDTVRVELAKQRKALKLDSEEPEDEPRLGRASERASHSANMVAIAVGAALTKQAINGQAAGATLQGVAEVAAERATAAEAMEAAPSAIADGRTDMALASPDVIGGYYTAVLDGNTCEQCETEDNGDLLSIEDAQTAAPNVNCEGGSRCRCMVVWVLSEDPVALGVVGGE